MGFRVWDLKAYGKSGQKIQVKTIIVVTQSLNDLSVLQKDNCRGLRYSGSGRIASLHCVFHVMGRDMETTVSRIVEK